jgi:hypothetical protein
MLEEAEQEDKRYFAIKYTYEMADAKAEREGNWNDDLEVIATGMAYAVTSSQRDLWEKERAVMADKSAADAMKLRAKYPDNME